MAATRSVRTVYNPHRTIDGAGVKLSRVFSDQEAEETDPFLLLDHFGSDNPDDYVAGFPWHPHRGIETVTYMLDGEVEHGDSLGGGGVIRAGDVQWMTAGSGIVHQEMPRRSKTRLSGFRLWVNLPAARKMIAPKYRGVEAALIPVATTADCEVKVICGSFDGHAGRVTELSVDVTYLDVRLQASKTFHYAVTRGHMAGIYLFGGSLRVAGQDADVKHSAFLNLTDDGEVRVTAGAEGARFLLLGGEPLREPIAWGGPIVMNTQEELERAFEEYRNGTFIK